MADDKKTTPPDPKGAAAKGPEVDDQKELSAKEMAELQAYVSKVYDDPKTGEKFTIVRVGKKAILIDSKKHTLKVPLPK